MKNQLLLLLMFVLSFNVYSQETYTQGTTEYYYSQYYSTTGKPVVKRSEANKKEFLSSRGFQNLPKGFQIDHIIPLCEGGSDDPSNMQLLTVEQHKRKTARERANRSSSTAVSQYDYKPSTTIDLYGNEITTAEYSRTDSNGRRLYRGTGGREYFVNSSGSKNYVQLKEESAETPYSTKRTSYYQTSTSAPSSSSGRVIHTGPRGGTYYINSNGNKTYTKK